MKSDRKSEEQSDIKKQNQQRDYNNNNENTPPNNENNPPTIENQGIRGAVGNNSVSETEDHKGSSIKAKEMEQSLKEEIEKAKKEYLYLRAEFDNYKRNSIKERSQYMKYGSENLIVDLLSILDNFERATAIQINVQNYQNYAKGVEMTSSEIKNLLSKFGVTAIESQGQPFDPLYHEALSSEVSSSIPPGHISQVLKKPYKLHDKIIRTGQVVVAKSPNPKQDEEVGNLKNGVKE